MARIHLAFNRSAQDLIKFCGDIRLLVSFAVAKEFLRALKRAPNAQITDWILDSGAFSFKHVGANITLDDFCAGIEIMNSCVAGPPREVYALDVIYDWRSTKRNVEEMWRRGYRAIPTYHYGEPLDVLRGYARDYPKVAIGGIARIVKGPGLTRFVDTCFSAVYPKPIHGFAAVRRELLFQYPFDSVDSAGWCISPMRYGQWQNMNGLNLGIRNIALQTRALVGVVHHFQKLERETESRWASDLRMIRKEAAA